MVNVFVYGVAMAAEVSANCPTYLVFCTQKF